MAIKAKLHRIFRNNKTKARKSKAVQAVEQQQQQDEHDPQQDHEHSNNKKPTTFLKRISTQLTFQQHSFNDDDDGYISQAEHDDTLQSTNHSLKDESSGFGFFDFHHHHHHRRPSKHQKQQPQVLQLDNATQSFQEQFETLLSSPPTSNTTIELVLINFVETSTRHDIYALRNLLCHDHDTTGITKLTLQDTANATNIRRWRYKKDNIVHHISKVCKDNDKPIQFQFQGQMTLNVDDVDTVEGVVALLQEIEKDISIVSLTVTGQLDGLQTAAVYQAIVSLITKQDRVWQAVHIQTGFQGLDYPAWRQTLQTYSGLFHQIQLQYGIPIQVCPVLSLQ